MITVYHGTNKECADKIISEGILRNTTGSMFGAGISTTPEAGLSWARRKCINGLNKVSRIAARDAIRVLSFDIDEEMLKVADSEMVENSYTLNTGTGTHTTKPIRELKVKIHQVYTLDEILDLIYPVVKTN